MWTTGINCQFCPNTKQRSKLVLYWNVYLCMATKHVACFFLKLTLNSLIPVLISFSLKIHDLITGNPSRKTTYVFILVCVFSCVCFTFGVVFSFQQIFSQVFTFLVLFHKIINLYTMCVKRPLYMNETNNTRQRNDRSEPRKKDKSSDATALLSFMTDYFSPVEWRLSCFLVLFLFSC
jgi:hypothetical protein